MQRNWPSLLSSFGVPVFGLIALLVSLWLPNATVKPVTTDVPRILLLNPNPRFDRSLTIFLRQQAREVARCRKRRVGLAQAVADYNLLAQECTPAVFQTTHLPLALQTGSEINLRR